MGRKAKWEEKQMYGCSKQQTNETQKIASVSYVLTETEHLFI